MNVRYALRTLAGVWVVPVVLALDVALVAMGNMPWRGDPVWTIDNLSGGMWLAGPLIAGVTALDAARLSHPGNIHLVTSTPGRQRPYVWAVLWSAVPVAVLHTFLVVAALAVGRVSEPATGWGSVAGAVVVQGLAPIWSAAVGSLIGRYLPVVVAGFAGAAVVFVAFLVVGSEGTGFSGQFALLELGAGGAPRIGWLFNPAYLVTQAGILLAMIIAWRWSEITERSGRVVPSRIGVVASLTIVALWFSAPFAGAFPGNRYVADPSPPSQCSGSRPLICTYPEHERLRADLINKIEHLVDAAFANGYDAMVPAALHEESRVYYPTAPEVRGLLMPVETALEQDHIEWGEVAYALAIPVHCDQLRADVGPSSEFWIDFMNLAFTWLEVGGIPLDGGIDWYLDPSQHATLMPEEAAEVVDRFARCELGRSAS